MCWAQCLAGSGVPSSVAIPSASGFASLQPLPPAASGYYSSLLPSFCTLPSFNFLFATLSASLVQLPLLCLYSNQCLVFSLSVPAGIIVHSAFTAWAVLQQHMLLAMTQLSSSKFSSYQQSGVAGRHQQQPAVNDNIQHAAIKAGQLDHRNLESWSALQWMEAGLHFSSLVCIACCNELLLHRCLLGRLAFFDCADCSGDGLNCLVCYCLKCQFCIGMATCLLTLHCWDWCVKGERNT